MSHSDALDPTASTTTTTDSRHRWSPICARPSPSRPVPTTM
ncbi:hypothetical protein ACFQHO_12120 [Actinomadura yumaensis]